MTSRIAFADLVSADMGQAPSLLFEQVISTMATGEGNNVSSFAQFNPIDTEWALPGSTPYNSAGVQNFPTLAMGVEATALTFGGWPVVMTALRMPGASVASVINAVDASDGVGGGYYARFVSSVLARWPAPGLVLVAGSSATPNTPERRAVLVVDQSQPKGPYWWVTPFGKQVLSVSDLHRADVGGFLPPVQWPASKLATFPTLKVSATVVP